MLKKALLAMTLAAGLVSLPMTGVAAEAPAAQLGFNAKFESNGAPIAEKPAVLKDFIEFRTARGFSQPKYVDMAGKTVSLESFKGKLVLVDVWATWCEPCIRSLPAIKNLQKHFNKEGSDVRIVSIALNKTTPRIKKFLKKNKWEDFETWHDPKNLLAVNLPLDVIPSFFVLDGHGHLVGFVRGFVDWSDPAVIPYLEKLAAKYAKRP